jgi:N-acetyl sugar amidotransferase
MDSSDSSIKFDKNGVCDYCINFYKNIVPNWNTNEKGEKQLFKIAEQIKLKGKGKDFDCIIGLSGGLDSSYLAYIATKILHLKPLLFHVDAGWNTNQAVSNIEKLVDNLGLDLYTEVVNWNEIKDLQVSLLKSQIPHQDMVQDTAFFSALYKFANKNKIKYVLTGGNYSTECCREPEVWGAYPGIDKKLLLDIHSKFGKNNLETFPIIDVFTSRIYYKYILGMNIIKPLNFIPYIKKDAEKKLNDFSGWQKFQHKHHESRFTRFFEDYWLPRKFNIDRRRAHFSSLILTGQMKRDDAINRVLKPELSEHFLEGEFEYVAQKLDLSINQLKVIFSGLNKTPRDYKNKLKLIEIASKVSTLIGIEKRLYK